jgi:hypothetical protein
MPRYGRLGSDRQPDRLPRGSAGIRALLSMRADYAARPGPSQLSDPPCQLGAGRGVALVSQDGAQIGQFRAASAQAGRLMRFAARRALCEIAYVRMADLRCLVGEPSGNAADQGDAHDWGTRKTARNWPG